MNTNTNMKPKPVRLIVEFKQFQRLPNWPIIKLNDLQRSSEKTAEQKTNSLLPTRDPDSGTHTLAD